MTTDRILKLTDQAFRLVYIVRNIAYHRSLHEYKDDFVQNYWVYIYNNFLDISVLEWCKVFGSRAEATHWSNHVNDVDIFREELLTHLCLSQIEWEEYWNHLKTYRDCGVAHHIHNPDITNYPDFDNALKVSYFYYDIVIQELRSLNVYDYPDNLQSYFDSCLDQAKEFSHTAYNSTINIKKQYIENKHNNALNHDAQYNARLLA
ncbi:MAG: hypothetical protein ACUZ8O_10995 [Candidatus Anammoxibacter sp.]